MGAKLLIGKPGSIPAARGAGRWPERQEHKSRRTRKIPYRNSATIAADALRQSA
jgi:hypothetical protein